VWKVTVAEVTAGMWLNVAVIDLSEVIWMVQPPDP